MAIKWNCIQSSTYRTTWCGDWPPLSSSITYLCTLSYFTIRSCLRSKFNLIRRTLLSHRSHPLKWLVTECTTLLTEVFLYQWRGNHSKGQLERSFKCRGASCAAGKKKKKKKKQGWLLVFSLLPEWTERGGPTAWGVSSCEHSPAVIRFCFFDDLFVSVVCF